jgi:hypothetical protein
MLLLYVILMIEGLNGDKEEIWVNEDLGTMLISKGLLLADQRSAYVSTFVKVPNPLSNVNLCNVGCGRAMEVLDIRMTGRECNEGRFMKGKDKVSDTVIKVIEYDQEVSDGVAKSRYIQVWCFLECLREDECQAFGVNDELCLLRSRKLGWNELEENKACGEWDLDCLTNSNRTRICEEFIARDPINFLMHQENKKFVEGNWKMLNQLIESSDKGRSKRSVMSMIGGGVLGFLATGFSFFEMQELKDHVEKLRVDYNEFKGKQMSFNRDQVMFNKKILMIYKGLERETQREIKNLHCQVNSLGFHILNMRRLLEWKDYLFQLYKDILGGGMVGSISTLIFTKDNIETIVKETALLHGTIYEEDPILAYRLGKMSIVQNSITEDDFIVHVVLKLPIIRREELKVIFEVKQTGVKHMGMACATYDLPRNVYRHEGRFYVLDSPMCSPVANIKLCTASLNSTVREMPCITDKERCDVIVEKCRTRIIQSVGGLLVRSDEEIRAATIKHPDTFEREKPTANTVMFYNYSEFSDVLVGPVKIRGIQSTTLERVVKLSSPKVWLENLKNHTAKMMKQNVSQLVKVVESQENTVRLLKEEAVIFGRGKWWVTPVTVLVILSTMAIYWCVGRRMENMKMCWRCCSRHSEHYEDISKVREEVASKRRATAKWYDNMTYDKLKRGDDKEEGSPEVIKESEITNIGGDSEEFKEFSDVRRERKVYTVSYPGAVPTRVGDSVGVRDLQD